MTLEEQRYTIERALGERMMHHAVALMKLWATEVNFSMYDSRLQSLNDNYEYIFKYYLSSSDDAERDDLLNRLTGHAYRLADELYADLRVKRGLSPEITSFNKNNPQSVARYFGECVHLQPEDTDWLRSQLESGENAVITLMAIAALAQNLQTCFSEEGMQCLIEAIGADNMVISEQALATTILLLIDYDTRIDYFPELQDLFMEKIGDGDRAFEVMCALVNTSATRLKDLIKSEKFSIDNLPDEIKELLSVDGNESIDEQLNKIAGKVPDADNKEVVQQIAIMPETWVFDAIIGEDEERNRRIEEVYLHAGHIDLMWDRLDDAEEILVRRIRNDKATSADYLNLGHCCFIRGDRMMAYEYYKEARNRYGSNTEFFRYFRPDRHMLVEKGVPLEQVYLMEDNLLY